MDADEMRGHMRAPHARGAVHGRRSRGRRRAARGQDRPGRDRRVHAVAREGGRPRREGGAEIDLEERNPLATDTAAIAKGRQLFEAQACGACHGDEAHGQEGVAPSLIDDEFLGRKGDLPDAAYFGMIKGGSE